MTTNFVIDLGRESIMTTLIIVGPVVAVGFIVGLIVSLFQAVTQLHEVTIGFVPKIVAISAALLFFGNWMLNHLLTYTQRIFTGIPGLIG